MCEFCHKHGDGKKWYLQAKNYSEDLLRDVRRREMIRGFIGEADQMANYESQFEKLDKAPAVLQSMIKWAGTRAQKRRHFGQVLPLEDVKEVFGLVNSIVRVPCICRHVTLRREVGYCYGISVGPKGVYSDILDGVDSSFISGPDIAAFESLTPEAALEAFAEHEKEGLCHSVWTFVTPFIGGVCNCDRANCLAMQTQVTHGLQVMFRAEYIASVDPDQCTGCRACMRLCQFGAIAYSAADRKAYIDKRSCYGCGTCRAACSKSAITLKPRSEDPAVAHLW